MRKLRPAVSSRRILVMFTLGFVTAGLPSYAVSEDTADASHVLDQPDETLVVDEGESLDGEPVGVAGRANNTLLDNAGTVSGNHSGVLHGDTGAMEVINRQGGQLTGNQYGVVSEDSERLRLVNRGRVSSGNHGVRFTDDAGDESSVLNEGVITGETTGMRLTDNNLVRLENTGEIQGGNYGIELDSGSEIRIDNAGAIAGDDAAIQVFGTDSHITLDNAGEIRGDIDVEGGLDLILRDGSELHEDAEIRIDGAVDSRLQLDGHSGTVRSLDERFSGFEQLHTTGGRNDLQGDLEYANVNVEAGQLHLEEGSRLHATSDDGVVVERDGLLSGHGTVRGDTVVHGRLQAGNKPGEIHFEDELVIDQGGQLLFSYASPDEHSQIRVDGDMAIEDNVTAVVTGINGATMSVDDEIVMVRADSITGTPDTTEVNDIVSSEDGEPFPFLLLNLSHVEGEGWSNDDPDLLILTTTANENASLEDFADNGRQESMAQLLQQAEFNDSEHDAEMLDLILFSQSGEEAAAWFDELDASIYPNMANVALENIRTVRQTAHKGRHDRYFNSLRARHEYRDVRQAQETVGGVWVVPLGTSSHGVVSQSGFEIDQSTGGFVLGLDARFTPHSRAGFLLGYAEDSLSVTRGDGDGESISLGGFLDYNFGGLQLDATVIYTDFDYDVEREVMGSTNSAGIDGDGLSAELAISQTFTNESLYITPSANLIHERVDLDGTRESGRYGRVYTDGADARQTLLRGNVDFAFPLPAEGLTALIPYAGLGYTVDLSTSDASDNIGFRGDDSGDTVRFRGDELEPDGGNVNLGIHAQFTRSFSAQAEFSNDDRRTFGAVLRWNF